MALTKQIVCLAASQKTGGRCIAGKEITGAAFGSWIRPISSRPRAEVSLEERQYADGTEPALLDILQIEVLRPAPIGHQTENIVIDPTQCWKKIEKLPIAEVHRMIDEPGELWTNKTSSVEGIHDRVAAEEALQWRDSLYLIRPAKLSIRTFRSRSSVAESKRKVRAQFGYNGKDYDFVVTDLEIKRRILAKGDASYRIVSPVFLCVSLAMPYADGYCYKLIASVIAPEGIHVA